MSEVIFSILGHYFFTHDTLTGYTIRVRVINDITVFHIYIFQVIIIIMVVNAKFEISVGHFIERMGSDR